MPFGLPSSVSSSVTWSASSRVGASTSAAGVGSPAETSSTIGSAKASVFPEPVGALPSTSRPSSATGTTRDWIRNGSAISRAASDCSTSALTPSAPNDWDIGGSTPSIRIRDADPKPPKEGTRSWISRDCPDGIPATKVAVAPYEALDEGGRLELRVAPDERGVPPAGGEQFLVPAALDDLATVEDDDLVGVPHGREPVRDRDRRPPLCQPVEGLLHQAFGLGVE